MERGSKVFKLSFTLYEIILCVYFLMCRAFKIYVYGDINIPLQVVMSLVVLVCRCISLYP